MIRFEINNEHLLTEGTVLRNFEEQVRLKTKQLEESLSRYSKAPSVTIHISKVAPEQYRLSVALNLNGKLLYEESKSADPVSAVAELLDTLRNQIKEQVARERKESFGKRKTTRARSVRKYSPKLEQFYLEKDREQFDELLKQLLPSLKRYVARFLRQSGKGQAAAGSVDDVVDEVCLAVYDRFSARPADKAKLTAWIYKIAKETMNGLLARVEDEASGQVALNTLAMQERKNMEEHFTADADGDLVMIEDLDDISYKNRYYGSEILLDNLHLAYWEELPEEDSSSAFHQEVVKVLETCDEKEKHVFELYWLDELSEEEISEATGLGLKEVKPILEKVTQHIAVHFRDQRS